MSRWGPRGLNAHAAEIGRMYAAGLNQSQIARICEVTPKAIRELLVRHGMATRPADGRPPSGTASYRWKGDKASYSALHYRVSRRRGKPSRCEQCGLDDPARMYHWANLTGRYEDPSDYQRMCSSCHKRFDTARQLGPAALSVSEAAKRIGIAHATLNEHIRRGLIAARKVGASRTSPYRITESALADYLQRRAS